MNLTVPANEEDKAAELTGAQFRDAMSRVATSVHVVTTDGAAGRFGMTASAVASVSDMPPTVLVCVNLKAPVNAAIKENDVFCVNALTAHDEAVADEAILAICEKELARFKRPKAIVRVPELPRNAMGKVVVDDVKAIVSSA